MSKLFGTKLNDFENEALIVHNELRRDHGVPDLIINKEISKVSQKWAEDLAKKDRMEYSLHKNYGESVYCGWSHNPNSKIKPRDCINKWYSEINEFSFGREPEGVLTSGHFTQIVWKNTKELGVGSAKSKSGKLYVVAHYYPPGNISGQFIKNVPPPGAYQFKSTFVPFDSARDINSSLKQQIPSQRNSKNLGDIASGLVSKFKTVSISGDKFEEEFLVTHNSYRRKHGVAPLELSRKLCKYAEEWAKVLVKKGRMEHRDQQEYGENIFYAWSSDPDFAVSGRDPVDKWYSEIKDHRFGSEPNNLGSGHFTQVIWEDSKEVGVGMARSKDGHLYVVANYNPPGNIMGTFSKKSKLFGTKLNDFENEALIVHNELRRDHGVPDLIINKEISKVSQKWAEDLAKKDRMEYSLHKNYGESVYCGWSHNPNSKIKPRDCINKWYSEINEFSFGREPEGVLTSGHFTQIVWKNTKELGVGSAKSKSGKLYVVAHYYPPGNISGQFIKNVPPPGAYQFKSTFVPFDSARDINSSLKQQIPSQRNSKNLGDIASGLVSKFKTVSISGDKFEEEFLVTHNSYRRKHGVAPLELSRKLCKYAEEWAKVLVKKGRMEHRDQQEYGENIFYAWSSDPDFAVSGRDPVDKWYSEIKDHRFGSEPNNLGSGHFTQVIWEDSKEVGVGMARSKDGHLYVVANYNPPGNIMGTFSKKVRPPL